MIPMSSRYHGVPTTQHTLPDGRVVTYLRRRPLPRPEELDQIGEHVVAPGERLDVIAFQVLGDAEAAWRIADANGAADPDELTARPGRRLRITLPYGIPGTGHGG